MIFQYANYRECLRAQLAERISKNSRYSLRAMARDIGLQPSHLSGVHSGKANLSVTNAAQVATRLGLQGTEAEYFCLLVEFDLTSNLTRKGQLLDRINSLSGRNYPVKDLAVDVFRTIADWYHLPILEITQCKGFRLTPESAADRLGISVHEARAAIDRLKRLELLVESGDGLLRKASEHLQIASEIPHSALRTFHRQMLEKAITSSEEQTPEEKYMGSETLAIDPGILPEVNKFFSRIRREFVSAFSQKPVGREVYHLGIQFFRLSKQSPIRLIGGKNEKVPV